MTTTDAKLWIASYHIVGKFGGKKFGEFGMYPFAKLSPHQTFPLYGM